MKYQMAVDVLKILGKEIIIKRGHRYLPYKYLPYLRTALVVYEVVMIGRKVYLSMPRKADLQVTRTDLVGDPE